MTFDDFLAMGLQRVGGSTVPNGKDMCSIHGWVSITVYLDRADSITLQVEAVGIGTATLCICETKTVDQVKTFVDHSIAALKAQDNYLGDDTNSLHDWELTSQLDWGAVKGETE